LTQGALHHLESYLAGRESSRTVSNWAMQVLSADDAIESPLLEEAIVALANLEHGDERLDTADEDLKFFRDCLMGRRAFEPAARVAEKRVN